MTDTRYRRDPAVTRRVVAAFVAYVEKVGGPQQAARVQADLSRHDLAQVWAAEARSDGFRPGDVADAMAAYWVLNWAMANEGDAGMREAAAVRAQLARTLAVNPSFARLSEAQRQEMAETYMVNFLYQENVYADAARRGDKALQQRLSDAAEQRFRNEMHMDLRGLRLTDHGFAQG